MVTHTETRLRIVGVYGHTHRQGWRLWVYMVTHTDKAEDRGCMWLRTQTHTRTHTHSRGSWNIQRWTIQFVIITFRFIMITFCSLYTQFKYLYMVYSKLTTDPRLLGQDQSPVAQRVKTTESEYPLTSYLWARFQIWLPHVCLDSGMVSPFRLRWVKGVSLFECNLEPALLAKWMGSFTCHCSTTGLERTPNKSQHTKLTLEIKKKD